MIRIGITGYSGFIGTQFRMFLRDQVDVETILIPRSAFYDLSILSALVSKCDALVHLAAVNRGSDEEIYRTNTQLAQNIIDACRATLVTPHIFFSSSIYADPSYNVPSERSKVFGLAKKNAEDLFIGFGKENGTKISIFRLPHVFGELAKPNHNSVVATLCHQIVYREKSVINSGAQIKLVYVGEVVSRLNHAIREGVSGIVDIPGVPIEVCKVYEFLKECMKEYREGGVPLCKSTLHVALFLTLHAHILRSYVRQSELQ